jgi:hypothetical protein
VRRVKAAPSNQEIFVMARDRLLNGAKEIAERTGRTERETFYQLKKGYIKGATKIGTQWVVAESKLCEQFGLNPSDTKEG